MTPRRPARSGDLPDLRRPPGRLPADAERPAPVLFDDEHRPIRDREGWLRRRAELRRRWMEFLGEIPHPGAPPAVEVAEEDRPGGLRRLLVRYEVEPGRPVDAYLIRPEAEAPGPRPGVAVFHSTTDATIRQPAGLDGPPEMQIGLHLARRGYVALCPRNFLWQEGEPGRLDSAVERHRARHPGVTGMARMLHDARVAVDVLGALDDVDPARIGAIGHSLGGKEALYLAAFDERVRSAVSSEGGIGLSYSNWDAPWYLGEAIRRPGFGLDHAALLALAAPRAFLLIGGDSADGDRSWPYIEAAAPTWDLLGAPDGVGLLNHRRGHEYPPEARAVAEAWLDRTLAHEPC